jgi:hypothetical protein
MIDQLENATTRVDLHDCGGTGDGYLIELVAQTFESQSMVLGYAGD